MNALQKIATEGRMYRAKHTKSVREIIAKRFAAKAAAMQFIEFALDEGSQCSMIKNGDGYYTVRVLEVV